MGQRKVTEEKRREEREKTSSTHRDSHFADDGLGEGTANLLEESVETGSH